MEKKKNTPEALEGQYSTRKQGKQNRYPSIYSPSKFIALPQYLAETMCERRASALKVELPKQFWKTNPQWKQYFFYQLTLARRLVYKYKDKAILMAIKELKYAYSLNIKKLITLIKKYEDEVVISEEVQVNILPESKGRFHRPKGKLDNLDG